MTPHRVKVIIDAYGADTRRWPADERDAASGLIARDHDLSVYLQQASQLDGLLAAAPTPHVPAGLAQVIMANAESPRTAPGGGSFGARLRVFLGRFWPDQSLWQPAMGLAASLAIGVWVGTLDIIPVTDLSTFTETASVLPTGDDGLLILYGDGSNLQEWVYDG